MKNIFVFDIETVPDIANGGKLLELSGLPEHEVAQAMTTLRRQETGHEFLPLHLHKIVAISAVLNTKDRLNVWSLGSLESPEEELIERFFRGIEQYSPTLVTWNGSGFDLPVLHYRALYHGISAPKYWETGDEDPGFRWNNYLNRYHYRHMDLMDILSGYQPKACASLEQIATMLGFPGKMGMHGSKVWQYFLTSNTETIRNYCETDALNTYLIYLRFELLRGHFSKQQYTEECQRLREMLHQENKPHLRAFADAWKIQT